jgi:hypothetical protein
MAICGAGGQEGVKKEEETNYVCIWMNMFSEVNY